MQCWPTVHKQLCTGKESAILPGSIWGKNKENYLCNVNTWLTNNFYEENHAGAMHVVTIALFSSQTVRDYRYGIL